jgi:hypothetical protein
MLRQPVFENPLIMNQDGRPLGLSGKSEGNAFANVGCFRIGDFWNSKEENWKGLSELGVSFHPINRLNRKLIIDSVATLALGSRPRQKGLQGCGPRGSPGVTSETPGSVGV